MRSHLQAAAAGLVTLVLGGVPAAASRVDLGGFDVSNALVDVGEILPGGPPRDGIPAIDRPRFVAAASVRFLRDDDLVVSLHLEGEARAYPLRILVWHEIVNDTVGGTPVAVTYCPLCGTAMVFDRRLRGRELTFGVSGLLYRSDVLMYDRQTESLWSQLGLKAVAGPLAGEPLTWLAAEQMTWRAWRERYPGGQVLSTRTGHRRDYENPPYAGYEATPRTMFPVPHVRTELPNKEWVVGVVLDGTAAAYPLAALADGMVYTDTVGGVRVRLVHHAAARNFAMVREDTGEAVPHTYAYWFAWQAFYPETTLWRP